MKGSSMKNFDDESYNDLEHLVDVEGGSLVGATSTDHFYFFCPKCNDTHVMQVLNFKTSEIQPVTEKYTKGIDHRKREFKVTFKLFCLKCKSHNDVKVSNTGLQEGTLSDHLTGKFYGKTLKWIDRM
jgi:ribosomal protein L44E